MQKSGKTEDQKKTESAARLAAVKKVRKMFGNDSCFRFDDDPLPYEGLTTGLPNLDIALGGNGVPRGRVVDLFGAESSGKSSLALQLIAMAQQNGESVLYIDAEHALDPVWCKKLGAKLEYVSQPSYGEEALTIAHEAAMCGGFGVIVVDSVPALIPKAELDGEIGDANIGLQARMMSQACRKLVGACHRTGTILLFINQLRDVIGVKYGPTTTTPGGRALKHAATLRIEMRRTCYLSEEGKELKTGDGRCGIRTRCKIVKNKVSFPGEAVNLDLYGSRGFDRVGSVVDVALEQEILTRSGSWYQYGEEKYQGRDQVVEAMRENPALCSKIESLAVDSAMRRSKAVEEQQVC